jgi:hypothetical protein
MGMKAKFKFSRFHREERKNTEMQHRLDYDPCHETWDIYQSRENNK